MKEATLACAIVLTLAGCASSSVIDLDSSTIQISTSAAPACGAQGAQEVAVKRAAIETINRGYDRYIILGGGQQNNVGVVGYTPITANTYGSRTYVSGGQPIIGGSHDQQLMVRMFRPSDPGYENAVDARRVLGPEWQKTVAKGPGSTC
jgi:hypothetical protein